MQALSRRLRLCMPRSSHAFKAIVATVACLATRTVDVLIFLYFLIYGNTYFTSSVGYSVVICVTVFLMGILVSLISLAVMRLKRVLTRDLDIRVLSVSTVSSLLIFVGTSCAIFCLLWGWESALLPDALVFLLPWLAIRDVLTILGLVCCKCTMRVSHRFHAGEATLSDVDQLLAHITTFSFTDKDVSPVAATPSTSRQMSPHPGDCGVTDPEEADSVRPRISPRMERSCVICLEDFEEGVELAHPPCGHVFHSTCIRTWLGKGKRSGSICPYRCPLDPEANGPLPSSAGIALDERADDRGEESRV